MIIYFLLSSSKTVLVYLALYALVQVTFFTPSHTHLQHVDHTDEEIGLMSMEDLLHVEHDLRDQNSRVDKHIASVKGRLSKLRQLQEKLEKKQQKAGAARDYEVRQRRQREKELERAHASLRAKQAQIQALNTEVLKLRSRIQEMSATVVSLNNEKRRLEDEYDHPSLPEAILHDAQRVGPVSEHVANKTIEEIFPLIETGLEEVEQATRILKHSSAAVALFTSFIVYLLMISLLLLTYRCVKNVIQRFTLVRSLLIIDLSFACGWLLVFLAFILISVNPFYVLALKHKLLSLLIQFSFVTFLAINVLFRCLYLSVNLKKCSVLELIVATFLAQHYYQSTWLPIIFDQSLTNGLFSYFVYMLVNAGLAVYRARTMGRPVEKLRLEFEEVDGIMKVTQWIKDKSEHVFRYCEDWLTSGTVVYDHKDEGEGSPRSRYNNTPRLNRYQYQQQQHEKPRPIPSGSSYGGRYFPQ